MRSPPPGQLRLEKLQGTADRARLESYLRRSDGWTAPALSERVELAEFAEKILKHGVAVVATTEQGQDVGVAAFYCNDQSSRSAYLTHLAVDPKYRRRGVATELLNAAKSFARSVGMRSMQLEVYASNSEAKKFYLLSGFSETFLPELVKTQDDSLYMSCPL